jgi:hypothetical protein
VTGKIFSQNILLREDIDEASSSPPAERAQTLIYPYDFDF